MAGDEEKKRLFEFERALKTRVVGRPTDGANEYLASIDSTNNRLAALAREGAPEGTTIIAREQTAGRGRLGRAWVSAPDSGLYMSTLLRPRKDISELPVITLCLGVAARRAVQAVTGLELGLKWVNDLVLNARKAGGILVELPVGSKSVATGQSDNKALVIGIGINIKHPPGELPEEIAERAIYLEDALGDGTTIDTVELAAELCYQIESIYKRIEADDQAILLDEWRAASVTLGREIKTASGDLEGTAVDIDETGALLVKTRDGTGTKILRAGEISIRSQDGSYS